MNLYSAIPPAQCAALLASASPFVLPEAQVGPQYSPITLVFVISFLVISLGIHEAAHAWVAAMRGDTTARDLGRMTLNPIAHIDPFLTILLPAVMYWTTGFVFGGAKPVPVVASRLHNPLRDMMLVALAGPASNLVLAFLFAAAYNRQPAAVSGAIAASTPIALITVSVLLILIG